MTCDDFTRAFHYACEAHRGQVRKGTNVPYVSHLLAIAALVLDYRDFREKLWERFNAPGADQLWCYRSLVEAFRKRTPSRLVGELDRTVSTLQQLEADYKTTRN